MTREKAVPSRKQRWLRRLGLLAFFGFVAFQVVAYRHAYRMTHFVDPGSRTPPPEKLTRLGKLKTLLTGVRIPRPTNRWSPKDFRLRFSTIRYPSTDGLMLEAWDIPHPYPKGVALLFHGYASSKDSLLHEAEAFYQLSYHTRVVDFRGSGGSQGNSTSIGVHEARDVVASVDKARRDFPSRKLVLFGFSMGAASILKAVADHKVKADALVLSCPFDRMLSTVRNRFRSMGVPSFPSVYALVFWGGWQHGFDAFNHNPAIDAIRVKLPTLLMQGTVDPRVTRAQSRHIFRRLTGPKQHLWFYGLGHASYARHRRSRWLQTVHTFLEKHIQPSR